MRHSKENRKFGLKRGQRRAFLKILEHNLIMKERMRTTEARAKEIRPMVERLVSHAKKQNLASFRLLLKKLPKVSANKIYYEIAPRYQSRSGGYLRIVKSGGSRNDGAKLATIEFVR